MPPTLIACCKVCAEPMMLVKSLRGWFFICANCDTQTEPRATAQLAAEDVRWVQVPVQRDSA